MADGSVIIDTELDQNGLRKGLSAMAGTIKTGMTMAIEAAGAALVGLGAYSIKVGSDFEYAVSNVAATMGKTKDEILDLSNKAKELGASTKFTATEAAEGFNILAMAGLKANEQLAVIESTLSLAAAGEMSMADAAGYITTTMKAMNIEMDEAGKNAGYVSDLFAKGATLANTSTAQLGDAVSNASAVAGTYNQSLETVGTSLLMLAEKGYQGGQAGNYLGRAMMDLYAPTDNAKAALDELGISAYDANGKQRDFIEVINDLNNALSGMTDEEKAAYTSTIFTTVGLKTFNSIAANSKDQMDALKESLSDCSGAAQQMAETKLDNLQGDITILGSATEGFGIAFYDAMTQVGTGTNIMRDFVQEATDIMSDLTKAVNEGGFDGLVDALGGALARAVSKIAEYVPMLIDGAIKLADGLVQGIAESSGTIVDACIEVIPSIISGIYSLMSNLVELGASLIIAICEGITENIDSILGAITEGVNLVWTTIIDMLPKIIEAGAQLVISLVEGIISQLPTIIDNLGALTQQIIDGIQQALPLLLNAVISLVQGILNALPGILNQLLGMLPGLIQSTINLLLDAIPLLIDAVIQIFEALVEALPDICNSIIEILPELIDSIISGILEAIPMLLECVLQVVLAIVEALPSIINTIVSILPNLIMSIIGGILMCLPQLLKCALDIILAIVKYLPEIIMNIVNILPSLISAIIVGIVDCIPTLIQCVADLILEIAQALPDIILTIVSILPSLIGSIINGLLSNIGMLIQCVVQMVVAIAKALPQIFLTIIDTLIQLVVSLATSIANLWTKFKEAAKEWIVKIWEGIKDKWDSLISNIVGFFKQIPKKITEAFGKISEIGGNLVKGIWNGIKDITGWILDKIKGFGKSILNGIKSIFGIASPSKVFRDEIGKNLMLGLAEGISENGDAAVAALEDVAEDISNVEFEVDDVQFDPNDYDGMVASITGAVQMDSANSGVAISANKTSTAYSNSSDDVDEQQSNNPNRPEYVQNDIYIDGKKTARVITPYISKEIEWEDK